MRVADRDVWVSRNLLGFRRRNAARSKLIQPGLGNQQLVNDIRHPAGLHHHHDGTR
jgi:hypothetical protein